MTETRGRDFRGLVCQGTGCLAPHKGSPNNRLGENTFSMTNDQCLVVGQVCISTLPTNLVFHICNTMLCIPVSKLKDEIK